MFDVHSSLSAIPLGIPPSIKLNLLVNLNRTPLRSLNCETNSPKKPLCFSTVATVKPPVLHVPPLPGPQGPPIPSTRLHKAPVLRLVRKLKTRN